MKFDEVLRKELLDLLDGGNAHMSFAEVIDDFPLEHINSKPPNSPYSFWHFVEHIHITQWDILEFIMNPDHVSPEYPEGYRPRPDERADKKHWNDCIQGIKADLESLREIVKNPKVDLLAPLPHARGYNTFREIVLVADHNAYHIGELAIMRQIMDIWPAGNQYLTGSAD